MRIYSEMRDLCMGAGDGRGWVGSACESGCRDPCVLLFFFCVLSCRVAVAVVHMWM